MAKRVKIRRLIQPGLQIRQGYPSFQRWLLLLRIVPQQLNSRLRYIYRITQAHTSGSRTASISESGRTTRCTARAKFSGPTVKYTKVSIKMTKNMALGCLVGPMGGSMLVSGNRANSMVRASIIYQIIVKKLGSGLRAKELSGSKIISDFNLCQVSRNKSFLEFI